MKNRKFFIYTTIIIIVLWAACKKDDLNQPATGFLYESDLTNKDGVEGLLIGAYSLLDGNAGDDQGGVGCYGCSASNWLFGSIAGDEAHIGSQQTDQPEMRDIEKFTATATDYYFDAKWSAIYTGVAKTNTVLRVMRQAHDMTPEDTVEVRAETLFLRAFYH
ncbi:MAG: RagB/SusD family nutrient uptake outer membrane protein, partial [Bacteroidota bacterium]